MKQYLLVYDVVSSRNRTVLYHMDGRMIREAIYETELPLTEEGRAEQDPFIWRDSLRVNTRKVLEGIDPSEVAGIGVTAQSEVCVFVDRNGTPVMNSINWSDRRGLEMPPIDMDPGKYCAITAGNCKNGTAFQKVRWIKKYRPEVYDATYKVLNCKDYLTLCLTGAYVTDHSDAAQLGCYDFQTNNWSQEIFDAAGIDIDKYPVILDSEVVAGAVTEAAAAEFGLAPGIPVVAGGGDCLMSGLGAGCVSKGDAYLQLGSSVWMSVISDRFAENPDQAPVLRNLCYVIPHHYAPLGIVQDFGGSFKWLKNRIFQYDPAFAGDTNVYPFQNIYPYTNIQEYLAKSEPGAKGLLYLPFILGRGPIEDDDSARGAYIGLTYHHTMEDMIRAALEGAAYTQKIMLERLRQIEEPKRMFVVGPGATEDAMVQVLADILELPLIRTTVDGTPDAIAAAVLAGIGAGIYADYSAVEQFWKIDRVFQPNAENFKLYRNSFRRFQAARGDLRGIYHDMDQDPCLQRAVG